MSLATSVTAAIVVAVILTVYGCGKSSSSKQVQAVSFCSPSATGKQAGEKTTYYRVDNLRSGSIKTEKGWNVQDFAHSMFNPNSEEITINLKMVSDDSKFVFSNGQVGTYTKTYQIKPMFGVTDNVYICPAFEHYKPNWPVSAKANFTGSVEFSGSKPFYYFMLHQTPVGESNDLVEAYYTAWIPCEYDEPAVWDDDLKQFVIQYTNHWHNETSWPIGWHSTLVIKNNTDQQVTYTLKHIPFYGGQYNPKNGWITYFREQVVSVPLQKHEEKKITLMELYGWPSDNMSNMEGCLLISPDRIDAAKSGTTANLLIVPNESGEQLHDGLP